MIITNTSAGTFLTDGPYVDLVPSPPAIPAGPDTALIAIVGSANWGPVNSPQYFSNPAQDGYNVFGNSTTDTSSLIDEAMAAAPECATFLGNRVTDSTDTAATILIKDNLAATLVTLTAKYTGSLANQAVAILTLVSGTTGAAPVYSLSIQFPGVAAEVFNNIAGSSGGGAFAYATFIANVLAAVNGTLQNQPGSQRWTATSGSGTGTSATTGTLTASGGTDGATITSAILVGTDGTTGRTGIYALRGLVQGAQVILSQLVDATKTATIVAFAQSENCSVWIAFASLTSTTTEVSNRATNGMSSPNLFLASDWDWMYDSIAGLNRLRSPMGKAAGIISAQDPWMYPGNKPAGAQGAYGIISTDRNGNPNTNPPSGATPISVAEAGVRQQAGILYLTNNPNLYFQNSGYGLPHGMASDGKTLISDVRMTQYIAFSIQKILGQFVGSMITLQNGNLIVVGPNGQLVNPQDAVDAFLNQLKNAAPPQIANYSNLISNANNTVTSVEQGFLLANIWVQTLSAAKFILAFLQVGNTVSIPAIQVATA